MDGSRESERVIAPALAWGAMLHEPLWLVEVAEPQDPVTAGDTVESGWLAALARAAGVDGWDVLHDHSPVHGLVDLATSLSTPTGLLVLATHGRTGRNRLRTGSVTVGTIRGATVPVLVVPAGYRPS